MSDLIITPSSGKIDFIYQSGPVGQEGQTSRLESIIIDPIDGLVFSGKISASSVNSPLNITATSSNINYPFIFASSGETGAKSLLMDSAGGTYNPSTNLATVNISGTSSWATNAVTNANLTGDVTSVGNATTIANSVVTNAKLANSSVTIGSTAISLGAAGAQTTIVGLVSVTSTTFVGALTGTATTASYANALNAANSYTVVGITGNLTGTATTASYANNLNAANQYTVGGITGSLFGTSSWASNAVTSLACTGNAATVTNGLYTNSTLTAGNLSGTIPSAVLGNSTVYIGSTAVPLNRANTAIVLTGITSIDGNAATATTASYANALNPANNYTVNSLTEGGYLAYPLREYVINFSALSATNFYPVAIDTPPGTDATWHNQFSVDMVNQSGDAAYNVHSMYGEVRGQGWTDQNQFYRVFHTFYDSAERSILGIWRGTQTFYGVVVYLRGGKNYYVRTTSRSAVGYSAAQTLGSAVFAIKNAAGADVSGTSANIGEMLNLINNPSGFYHSDNAYIGTDKVLNLATTSAPNLSIGGTAATATNSTQLNGQAASYYTDITARLGYTPVDKAGDTVTGNLIINGNFSVNGSFTAFSASNVYISSSQLYIEDNILTLNAFSPYLRYAGVEMYDSGSGTLSSLLWDGEADYFFLSGSSVNGKIITGPDSQANLSANFVPKATAGYKLGNSIIYDNGTSVGIGTTTVNQKVSIYPGTTGGISLQDIDSETRAYFFIDNTNPTYSTGIRTQNYYLDFDSSGGSQNAIRFYTGTSTIGTGTERMRIISNGNVGIGTNTPGALFEISSSTAASLLNVKGAGGNGLLFVSGSGNVGIGTTSPAAKLQVNSTTAGATLLRTDGTNGTLFSVVDDLSDSLMSVNNSAGLPVLEVFADDRLVAGQYGQNDFVLVNNKVGIGTNNPANKLTVSGSVSIGESYINTTAPSNGLAVQGNVGIGTTSPGQKLEVATTTSNTRVRINSTEVVATEYFRSGTGVWLVGSDSSNSFKIARASNFGTNDYLSINSATADVTFFDTALGARMTLNGTGLGIGTTLPAAKLHVQGNISGSSFTSSISNAVGFLGTSSWATNATNALQLGGTAAADYVTLTGTQTLTGKTITGTFTGNLTGTATTASYANALNAANSYTVVGITGNLTGNVTGTATTASYANALNAANSYTVTGITGALTGTSSWATNATNALQLGGTAAASYVTLTGTQTLTGKTITGTFTGNLTGTASWSSNAVTALNGGVTSVSGTENQVIVSGNTGAVTFSLPQSIHTTATPTFTSVSATTFTGALTGTATTASYANALNAANNYTVAGLTGNLTGTSSWASNAVTSLACTGNAGTVTNGVYTTGNQSIAGTKTFTGVTSFSNTSDYQIVLDGSGGTWAGINWSDVNGVDVMWFNGQNKTFAIGGGGSNVSGKKLHVDGGVTIGADYDATVVPSNGLSIQGGVQIGNYSTYVINTLGASGTQSRTFEIARLGIDYNDWNNIGTFEVEIHEKYYSKGLKKVYNIWYGYPSDSGIRLVELRGTGDNNFQCRIGSQVQISGDSYYLPVYVDIKYYSSVDVVIKTNRNITTTTNPEIGYTYINIAPTPTNISSFTADSDLEISTLASAKLGGNTILTTATTSATGLSIGGTAATASYANALNPANSYTVTNLTASGVGKFFGNIAIITDASAGDYSLIAHKYDGVTKAFSGYNGGMAIYGGETGIPTRIQAGGQYALTALTNGNIGIGTTSPTAKLVVMGDDVYNYTKSSVPTAIIANDDVEFLIGSTDNLAGEEITLRLGTVNSTYYTYGAYVKAIQGTGVDYYKLAFGTSNGAVATTKMTIANDGNVGIGTTVPVAKLHLNSTTAGATLLRTDGTNGTLFSVVDDLSDSLMSVNNSAGLPVLEVFADDRIVGGQYGQNDFVVVNNKVGIGTNNPGYKLDVVSGSIRVSSGAQAGELYFGITDNANIYLKRDNNYDLTLAQDASSGNALYLAGAGNVYVSIDSNNNETNRAFIVQKDAIKAGAELFRVQENGKVGIGTTVPTSSLHIKPLALGADLLILERYATQAKLIYAYESAADGYLEVRSGADVIISKLSGYASTPSYFQSNVGIGITVPTAPLHVVGVISGSSFTGAGTGLTGTAANLTAGTASALSSMNISQFTNNSGYLTSVTNISGNAATATIVNGTNGQLLAKDIRTIAPNNITAGYLQFGFTAWNNNGDTGGIYADYLHLRSYPDSSGGLDNLLMFRKVGGLGIRLWQQTFGSATAYATYKDVCWTDGTNASGNWSITSSWASNAVTSLACTGNAATVTTNANLTGHITSTGNATILGSFTSAQLLAALTDETGTGANVFATSPTLVSPILGTPTSGVLTNCTGTAANLTAGAVTNGVYTTGNQSIAGNKTFTGTTIVTGSIETAAVRETFSAVSSTTTVSIDLSTATVFNLTFTSTISAFNITNVNTSRVNSFTLITAPNGTAATIAWSFQTNGGVAANVKWASNVSPTATTTNGRFDIFSFVYNGTNWYGFTGGQNYV